MSNELFLSLIVFAFVSAITPGPNNTMLLASGVNFGFARTRPHILGVVVGFVILLLAAIFGIGQVLTHYPPLYGVLRVISVAYLLWLAWRIGTAGATDPVVHEDARPMTFLEAVLFQWVNPKAFLVCVSVAANYVVPAAFWDSITILLMVFLIVSIIAASSWAFFGSWLRPMLKDPRSMRIFNVAMALALVASLWPIVEEMT